MLLVIDPDVAVMSVVSAELTLCAVASPLLSIVATLVFADCQVTASVMSIVLPSSSVPVAWYCTVLPEFVESSAGVIAIDFRFATVTVTVVEPLMAPDVAVILAFPTCSPVTRPEFETVAAASLSDDQLTEPVMSFVLPSLYVPVAVICLVELTVTEGVTGVTVMELRVGSTKNPLQPHIAINRMIKLA